ncbi:MAG: DUF2085 domain-containing protein [Anaerolineaceae bacterium]|nr:DUF2085 domain-containing protein [Anaerolineaceae bacterium]
MDTEKISKKYTFVKILLAIAAIALFGVWLWFSPPGIFGKADAVGYAVCHQIPERSFIIGERVFPLCARCSGMYLGAFIGFLFQLKRKRHGDLPPKKLWFVFGALFLFFAVDGSNSYLHFFENAPSLYEPNNNLRLISGLGLGVGMAAVLYPIFHQTMWKDWIEQPSLSSYVDVIKLVLLNAIMFFVVNSGIMPVMFLMALISTGTIVYMLSLIYTILVTMILKKENIFSTISDTKWMVLAGFCCAIAQIALMDFIRFKLTGTWAGFSF